MTAPTTPDQIRQTVRATLTSPRLHITESMGEIIITNPYDEEKGQICIDLDDGHVTWEYPTWTIDHWGPLQNTTPAGPHGPTPITPDMITQTLLHGQPH